MARNLGLEPVQKKLTIGVAMCTYNGERYLANQLESIARQSRTPDLLLICDDASSDTTVELLQAFRADAAFPVSVFVNEINLGYLRNFENAIAKCDADIIVLCDQDDYWRSDKLEILNRVFAADSEAGGVFSDAQIVNDDLIDVGYTLLDAVKANDVERNAARSGHVFPALLRHNLVCGATLAIRAEWKSRVIPFPQGVIHDEWIALVIAAHEALRFIPEALIRYRQHGANQIGLTSANWRRRLHTFVYRQGQESRRRLLLMRALQQHLLQLDAPAYASDEIASDVEHLQRRLTLPRATVSRMLAIATEMRGGRYSRYSSGWLSALRDLILPMK